jgi:tetratricopeptide (TPR) repeat protein
MTPSRLAATLAALLATPAPPAPRGEGGPAPVTAAPAAPGTPNSKAMLLFEDATKAAEAQAKSGQRDDAALERRFLAVQQADSTFAEADYNLGVLAERQGKRDQAFALYRSALQKKPSLKPAAAGLPGSHAPGRSDVGRRAVERRGPGVPR